jgi:hypothetical protein
MSQASIGGGNTRCIAFFILAAILSLTFGILLFGRCPYGDRLAEMAALAIAIVLVGMLAALKTHGWRVAARSEIAVDSCMLTNGTQKK